MVKLFDVIRAPEWWGYKLPPLLSVAYATSVLSGETLYSVTPYFLFFLASLAVGAIYVSVINDFTDIEEDLAVGKDNRMARLAPWLRWLIVIFCILTGIGFCYVMWPDILSVSFYTGAWLSFTLYSVSPFRLKKRGIWGVVCDASGAHFFPSLLMVSGIAFVTNADVKLDWLFLVAVWAISFGCRGILWHQFIDRANDIKTNTRTFAVRVAPHKFKPYAVGIFCVELSAFLLMLLYLNMVATWVSLVLYGLLVLVRYYRYANVPIIIMTPKNKHAQVLMIDYYQTFFPLSILVWASFNQSLSWIVLVSHIFLFPSNMIIPLRDYWMAMDAFYRKIRYSS